MSVIYGESIAHDENKANVTIITSQTGVNNSQTLTIGLQFELKEGWHTYWKSPGVVGYPAKINWVDSENIDSIEAFWPFPERFSYLDIVSHGYSGEVILPILIRVKDKNKPVKVHLFVNYLVCSETECKMEKVKLSHFIPEISDKTSKHAQALADFSNRVPELIQSYSLILDPHMELNSSADHHTKLTIKARTSDIFSAPEAFLESPVKFYTEAPEIILSEDKQQAKITFTLYNNEHKKSKPKDEFFAQGIKVSLKNGNTFKTQDYHFQEFDSSIASLLLIFAAALLGGFILNFMPCVLPVLSIKIFALLKSKHEDQKSIRKEYLITTLGIVSSFIVLGLIAIFLKGIGVQVGWGMQFQQPLFMAFIVTILILFSANLWNIFDLPMPRAFSKIDAISSLKSQNLSHFFTGAFVTILATPCTAPFIATAISFSLSRGPVEIIFIFFLMGIGLALPYIIIASIPKLAQFLPKPGNWILILKKVLGLIVFGTALWFCSILFIQVGVPIVWLVVFFSVLSILMVALYLNQSLYLKRALWGFVIIWIISLFILSTTQKNPLRSDISQEWIAFDQSLITEYTDKGKIVLVNVSADWCLTCKANENLVLKTNSTNEFFKKENVIVLYADWTSPDKRIAEFLRTHNEYAIPFYVLYTDRVLEGYKLPQILTKSIIQEAILKIKQESKR